MRLPLSIPVILLGLLAPFVSLVQAQEFSHPGLLNNERELDAIRSIIKSNRPHPMQDGWKHLQRSPYISLTYTPTPRGTVNFDNGAGEAAIRSDAHRVYACALAWVVTGNIDYANKAIEIMNCWSTNLQVMTGPNHRQKFPAQACLEISWYAPIFCAGAEIIRYYRKGAAGWKDSDIAKFEAFLVKCEGLSNHITGGGGHPPFNPVSNWGTSAIFSKLAIAVFTNNRAAYKDTLAKYFSQQIQTLRPNGETSEVFRDRVHAQYAMVGIAMIAEIERHQGSTAVYDKILKGSINDRIPRLFLVYKTMNQIILGEVENSAKNKSFLTAKSAQGQEIVLNYYKNISKGTAEDIRPIEAITLRDRPNNTSFSQFPYFTTLTHADLETAVKSTVGDHAQPAAPETTRGGLKLRK